MNVKKVLTVAVSILLTSTFLLAQGGKGTTNTTTTTKKGNEPIKQPDGTYKHKGYTEANRPEDSYLAKFHAIDVVNKLMKDNLEKIYLLNVMTQNFGEGNVRDVYKKCYQGYKKAMQYYYRRNVIYSRVEFEKNRKALQDLLRKLANTYKKKTDQMLDICATKIMLQHLDATTRSNPDKHRSLQLNQMRLRIAYGQFDDADGRMKDHLYDISIYHYRVAKSYAIKILAELSKPDERKKLLEQYKVDRADNLNRIFNIKKK